MAAAETQTTVVTEVTGYVLTLTAEEGQTLFDFIGHTATGSPVTSRRKHTDAIYNALSAAGLTYAEAADLKGQPTVYFKDQEEIA